MTFDEWWYKQIDDNRFWDRGQYNRDCCRKIWDYQQKEIDRLNERIEKLIESEHN